MNKISEIEKDTGMEIVCSVCLERKSYSQCSLVDKLKKEEYRKYIIEHKLSLSIDENYYICLSCKLQLKKNKEPRRSQKEVFGFLNFPDTLKVLLETICTPKDIKTKNDPEKKYLALNRCEDYLLKLCIPFIRVAHLPRGRYFKVIGDLILISADIMHSFEKIIPAEQSLIPVSFKRRLQYKGHYIEEYVDKEKLLSYFQWFRENNHLYKDFQLDSCLVDKFIAESMEKSKQIDEENVEVETDEEEEIAPSNHSTHLRNKYMEDITADTVANNLADLIVHFEKEKTYREKKVYNDEEEIFYSDDEDEIFNSDEEEKEDDDEDDKEKCEDLVEKPEEEINEFQLLKEKTVNLLDGIEGKCKHDIKRVINSLFGLIREVQSFENLDDTIKDQKSKTIDDISSNIRCCIQFKKINETIKCQHAENEGFKHLLENSEINENDITAFATKSAKEIRKKGEKIYVAPGEKGKFMNWQDNIFIEEMAFPALFPYGVGGYLSSNILSGSDIGFANYCRNRIMSADPKFRNDQNYIFFLLLVKEMIEMKRSKSTFIRKAAKHPKLTKKVIKELKKENLSRNNNVFNVYKNLRGSAPYYQKAKKDLFATIRQHGAPTIFQTFSCAEYEWDSLCKQIYETVNNERIDIDEIKSKDNKWKNKLVSENVVQSTLHFEKRTQKLIALMCSDGFYNIKTKDGKTIDFNAENYFYRVEFQQRGAPHIHCLLWLKGKEEEVPPTLWIDENDKNVDKELIAEEIALFASSLISGSSSEAHCLLHDNFQEDCPDCIRVKANVEKFQKHNHTFTCKKKKRIVSILPKEGHGKHDGQIEGEELKLPVCRFRLPFYPLNETKFIFPFEEDYPKELKQKAENDFSKVKKFILRMTNDAALEECPNWTSFKKLDFKSFLCESGMLDEKEPEENQFKNASERYINALRCDVRNSGLLILKRAPCDVFTNNYNNKLMNFHAANQDIQYVSDMWACAQYVTNYLTKSETNISSILKHINEESVKKGLQTIKIIDKLSRALDKNREVSIQETVYRILGLSMCKFSRVIQFISTVHPHKRDGLLRANIDKQEDETIFHDSIFTYYEARPMSDGWKSKDFWDKLSLSEFIADFEVFYGKASPVQSKKLIKLENKKGFIKERKTQKTLRYYLNHENDEDFCRALCILFLPFRNEMTEIHSKDVISLVEENRDIIDEKRSKFEKHLTLIEILEKMEKNEQQNILEEDDEEDDPSLEAYIEDETTDIMDREEFEKLARKDAESLLNHFKDEINMRMDITELRDLISGLNIQQREIFDDYVERLCDTREDKLPFYLYIGGEAGTGKSHLIKVMIEATKLIGKHSGGDLDKPSVLIMAPTGNAAYIINGKTIESALGMKPQKGQGYMKMSSSVESTLRFTYEDLLTLFIDEVSMVGSNKFSRINFRLQDIRGIKEFMGGVPMVATGDFGQLPPVGDRMIWENSSLDGRPLISPNHWDENFYIYYLTQKMRTKDDKFANYCDKIRKGLVDEDVEKYLKSCVVENEIPSETSNDNFKFGKLSIIVPNNKKREKINNQKLEKLLPDEKLYYAEAVDRATNFRQSSQSGKKQSKKDEGQLSANLLLKNNAPVVITCNHSEAKYRDDGINNGARGYIDSIQTNPNDPDMVDVVWIVFNDKSIGQRLRQDKKYLLSKHTPENEYAVPIEKQKKQYRPDYGNISYQRSQFPLTLAYALTSHKCQGQTLDEVIIDFRDTRVFPGSFYVALTRVKIGNKVYLRQYDRSYISVNEEVERKLAAMKLFRNYVPFKVYLNQKIFKKKEEVKIGYLNINGLMEANHGSYLDQDKNLLNLDILVLAETKLKNQADEDIMELLSNWVVLFRQDSDDSHIHMGMLCLISKASELLDKPPSVQLNKIWSKNVAGRSMNHMQMISLKVAQMFISVSFIYVRKTPDIEDIKRIKKYSYETEVLMGDLNINMNISEQKKLMTMLCDTGKKNVLNDVTTDKLNQLDYILIDERIIKYFFATAYKNFISDHKSITIRIPSIENEFCENFIAKQNFDEDHHLKKKNKFKLPKSTENLDHRKHLQYDSSTTMTDLELSSLKSPNWIQEGIVNHYFQLIKEKAPEYFAFSTEFFTEFNNKGYKAVTSWYRQINIFSYKKIFIPVFDKNHCFLMVIDNENSVLEIYDPYGFTEYKDFKKMKLIKENKSYLDNLSRNLIDKYFKPKYEKCFEGFVLNAEVILHLPPEIPTQINDFDCGIYLIQFAKHIVHGKPFTFESKHMLTFRHEIEIELQQERFTSFRCVVENIKEETKN